MKPVYIRGTACVFNLPSLVNASGERNVFRPGCFDHVDLTDPKIVGLIEHSAGRVFAQNGISLHLWQNAQGLQFEALATDCTRSRLVVAGVRSGIFKGSSIGCRHSGSKKVLIAGMKCVEVHRVEILDDISVCSAGLNSFSGVCLVDVSQRPRASAPRRGRGRSTAQIRPDLFRRMNDSRNRLTETMDELAAKRLGFSATTGIH
jgi:phage head maturation protease